MIKGFAENKMISINTCIECNAPCKVIKVIKTKTTREKSILTGMVWVCNNGHINRTRKHKLERVKR